MSFTRANPPQKSHKVQAPLVREREETKKLFSECIKNPNTWYMMDEPQWSSMVAQLGKAFKSFLPDLDFEFTTRSLTFEEREQYAQEYDTPKCWIFVRFLNGEEENI